MPTKRGARDTTTDEGGSEHDSAAEVEEVAGASPRRTKGRASDAKDASENDDDHVATTEEDDGAVEGEYEIERIIKHKMGHLETVRVCATFGRVLPPPTEAIVFTRLHLVFRVSTLTLLNGRATAMKKTLGSMSPMLGTCSIILHLNFLVDALASAEPVNSSMSTGILGG